MSLAWDTWGDGVGGSPLVLCHGFSGSTHDFALNIAELASSRAVVAVDHRGHGRSEKLGTLSAYSVDRLADDFVAFLDGSVGQPIDLLGHSMGGAIALRVTLRRPDLVRSLVLMDTSGWSFLPPDPALARMMAGFIADFDPSAGLPDLSAMDGPETALITASTPPEWQELKEQMAAAFDPFAMKALASELFDESRIGVRDRLGEIRCPVTVVVGEFDVPFVAQAAELAGEVGDGRVSVIPGAYHSPQLTHRGEWASSVERHLTRPR